MNTWKAILAALVIFGAGLVTGAAWVKLSANSTTVTVAAGPRKPATNGAANGQRKPLSSEHLKKVDLMMRVQKDLNLTPEQRERIEGIISDGQERIRDLWHQVAPEIQDELNDVKSKLCKELTPEQNQRFDELMKQQSHKKSEPAKTSSTNEAPAVVPQ